MNAFKQLVIRYWPTLRLRTLIFAILVFVAALPGVGALYLRVYENALVRQTEAEVRAVAVLIAQDASLQWDEHAATSGPRTTLAHMLPHRFAAIDVQRIPILPDATPRSHIRLPIEGLAQRFAAQRAPLFAAIEAQIGVRLMLLDQHGVIATGDRAGEMFDQPLELKIALAGQPATVLRRDELNPPNWLAAQFSKAAGTHLIHSEPVMVDGHVVGVIVVSKPPQDVLTSMWLDRYKIELGVAIILMTLVILSLTLARTIVRPLERLSSAAQAVATGRSPVPNNPSLPVVEIEALYDQYRAMSRTIAQRAGYLRDFAAALSHEFKTPLTGLRGGIELLQDHGREMDESKRSQFLANMADDAAHLTHLLNRLMVLAQADLQYPDGRDRANVTEVLNLVANGLRRIDFEIDVSFGKDLPAAAIDSASLERIATILIENAIQAGATKMQISANLTADGLTLTFADNGPGIPEADAARIFTPFFTSKRARGGTGLGLPIARSLIEANGGRLDLLSPNMGTCFAATVRVAPSFSL